MEKTEEIYVRIGFSDVIMRKEAFEKEGSSRVGSFVVGHEDKDGRECTEEGVYYDSIISLKDNDEKIVSDPGDEVEPVKA